MFRKDIEWMLSPGVWRVFICFVSNKVSKDSSSVFLKSLILIEEGASVMLLGQCWPCCWHLLVQHSFCKLSPTGIWCLWCRRMKESENINMDSLGTIKWLINELSRSVPCPRTEMVTTQKFWLTLLLQPIEMWRHPQHDSDIFRSKTWKAPLSFCFSFHFTTMFRNHFLFFRSFDCSALAFLFFISFF